MADDTQKQKQGPHPTGEDKPFTQGQWSEAEPSYKPPENANLYAAAAAQHTAGGSAGDVTVVDAAKVISSESFAKFPKKPCVKDSLLAGMTAGFAMGSVRAIWRAPIQVACNWAVGTFCIGSFSMYQYCQYQREAEKAGMKRAIEIIDRKQIERKQKEARMDRARELRRQKKEEEEAKKYAELGGGAGVATSEDQSNKSSWKLW